MMCPGSRPRQQPERLAQPRLDDLCERVSGAVEPRFHGSQIAVRDLRDLLVRLPLELAQDEHLAMMLREPSDGRLDEGTQVAAAIEIVGARVRVLELQRTIVVLPVLPDRLEKHEWVA